jgi:aryl-alcohol dehydrogenase-like predicted oxidoreductase
MLDVGTANGINLVDTAEQYPIPSDLTRPEGRTEEIIGKWLARDRSRRDKLVIATKITGGANVTPKNIIRDCEGSLRRLQTDYIDVYNLHWPAATTLPSTRSWGPWASSSPRGRYGGTDPATTMRLD